LEVDLKYILLGEIIINGVQAKASDVIRDLIKAPAPGRGFDLSEMRMRLKVMDRLEKANGFVNLEDAEHATLCSAISSSVFVLADQGLLDLMDRVLTAKEPEAS
jgi:hypothetical protein